MITVNRSLLNLATVVAAATRQDFILSVHSLMPHSVVLSAQTAFFVHNRKVFFSPLPDYTEVGVATWINEPGLVTILRDMLVREGILPEENR